MSKKLELKVMRLFNTFKQQLLAVLGNKATNSKQLEIVSKTLFGDKFIGVYAQDKAKLDSGYQIINVGLAGSGGTHWVGLYIPKKGSKFPKETFRVRNTAYIYDSFGRKASKLLKKLTKYLKDSGYKIVNSDRDHEQRGNSEVCGVLVISWLAVIDQLGIKKALLI